MESCDTNILLYYLDQSCREHRKAKQYIETVADRTDFVICDLVLIELYVLLRNPRVLKHTLTAREARSCCLALRHNPRWQIVEYSSGVMEMVWSYLDKETVTSWQIYDIRLGMTLLKSGVDIFATRNTKDFAKIGFKKLLNPIDD